jgi:hypothetical protein
MDHDLLIKEVSSLLRREGYESLRERMATHSEWVGETTFEFHPLYLSAVVFQELDDERGAFLDMVVEGFRGDGIAVMRDQCSFYRDGQIECEALSLEK